MVALRTACCNVVTATNIMLIYMAVCGFIYIQCHPHCLAMVIYQVITLHYDYSMVLYVCLSTTRTRCWCPGPVTATIWHILLSHLHTSIDHYTPTVWCWLSNYCFIWLTFLTLFVWFWILCTWMRSLKPGSASSYFQSCFLPLYLKLWFKLD